MTSKYRKKTRLFRGLPVSKGIAIGNVYLVQSESIDLPKFSIRDPQIQFEISRFHLALKKTRQDLVRIRERLCKFQVGDQIRIIDYHLMIINDEMIVGGTTQKIRQEKINAEWAFDKMLYTLYNSFPESSDNTFQEKRNELNQLGHRILQNLLGSSTLSSRHFPKNSIIIARELAPTDTAQMVKGDVQGFVTETGGPTSHTSIFARALEIPAVVGIDDIFQIVREGDWIVVDGSEGTVILHPTRVDLNKYKDLQKKYARLERLLRKDAHLKPITLDGYRLRLAANMEFPEEIPSIKKHGADGIGLYRTEMLYLKLKRFPTEEEQFEVYRTVLKSMRPRPTTIRTLDIGADKLLAGDEYLDAANPALGLRAIRYGLKWKDLLKNQLRAILRASRYGPVKILIPMISNLEEVRTIKKIIADMDIEKDNVTLGAMIEVPGAALIANELAAELDFLSIGTNDLIQYTLAVDRDNDDVSHLYEPLHPAVLKLLKMVCDAGRARNIEVSVCGEMANDPLCFLILLGLGLTELSMNPLSIPRVKKLTRTVTFHQAAELLDRALDCKTAGEVIHLIKKEISKIDGFPIV